MRQAVTTVLLAHLGGCRRHVLDVLGGLGGLGESQLRTATLPSGWAPWQLASHLTHDVERFWFGAVVAGDPAVVEDVMQRDAWHPDPDRAVVDVVAGYPAACARSDEILAGRPFDAAPAWWPAELFGDWRLDTVGEVVLHVIGETATHAGHLDAAVELLDGRTWLVLD